MKMKMLFIGLLSVSILNGCSSNSTLPESNLDMTNRKVSKCVNAINKKSTYWGRFERGAIYLYRTDGSKCMLKRLSSRTPTKPSSYKTMEEANQNAVKRLDKPIAASREKGFWEKVVLAPSAFVDFLSSVFS